MEGYDENDWCWDGDLPMESIYLGYEDGVQFVDDDQDNGSWLDSLTNAEVEKFAKTTFDEWDWLRLYDRDPATALDIEKHLTDLQRRHVKLLLEWFYHVIR